MNKRTNAEKPMDAAFGPELDRLLHAEGDDGRGGSVRQGGGVERTLYATKIYTPPPINVYSV